MYLWALMALARCNDAHNLKLTAKAFWDLYQQAPGTDRKVLRTMCEDAGIDFISAPPWDEAPPSPEDENDE